MIASHTPWTRRAEAGVKRRAKAVLRRLPVGRVAPRGTVRDRAVAEQAAAVLDDDPQAALALVEPLIPESSVPRVWTIAVRALRRTDERTRALETALEAERRGTDDVNLLLTRHRIAEELEDAAQIDAALTRLAGTVPNTQGQIDKTAERLGEVGHPWLDRYVETVQAARVKLDQTAMQHAAREAALEREIARGPEGMAAALDTAAHDGTPPAVLSRVLIRHREWKRLADLLDSSPGGKLPVTSLGRAALRALTEGDLDAGRRIGRRALALGASARSLDAALAEADDQAAILASGWAMPVPGTSAHTPREGAVVYALGQSLPIRTGGYATRSHGILTSLRARGWDMAAATRLGFPYDLWWSASDTREVAPVDVVDGVPYHRLLNPGQRDYPRWPMRPYVSEGGSAIARVGREHGAEIVHAASLYDVGIAGLLAARELGVPFVYEMRGLKQLLEDARVPRFIGSEKEAFLDLVEREVAVNADRLLVITEALGRRMVDEGVDPSKVVVIPNGVHVDRFTPRERDRVLEAELGLQGKTAIGYVGGFVVYEGLELLLEAAAALRSAGREDFHLLLVGDGAHQRHVRARARQLGLGDDILTMPGRVPHEVVERYLSLVDIAPFPRQPLTVCELISPIKPFESMAMKKAVVVSDVAALTEIVADGVTGRSFAKGDSTDLARVLCELLDDPAQRDRLGEAAREWVVAERDWAAITERVDATYRELLGR